MIEPLKKRRLIRRPGIRDRCRKRTIADTTEIGKIARDSGKFQRIYNSRTSAERYHGRMDRDFCFENHTIRNLAKMDVAIKIANIIMLGMAVLHINRHKTNCASLFAI